MFFIVEICARLHCKTADEAIHAFSHVDTALVPWGKGEEKVPTGTTKCHQITVTYQRPYAAKEVCNEPIFDYFPQYTCICYNPSKILTNSLYQKLALDNWFKHEKSFGSYYLNIYVWCKSAQFG